MQIWAISDPHLSFAAPKPMDIFGERWRDHDQQIARAWTSVVQPEDVVLVPGDISWAMRMPEALLDLQWIDALPGRKVLAKGNHDYWWSTASKVRAMLPPSLGIVDSDAIVVGDLVVCGTRGWMVPGDREFDAETDEKIYQRELGRLDRALAGATALAEGRRPIVVLLHYPPFRDGEPTAFAERIATSGAVACVYGHLHQPDQWASAVVGDRDGVRYYLAAADAVGFAPIRIEV